MTFSGNQTVVVADARPAVEAVGNWTRFGEEAAGLRVAHPNRSQRRSTALLLR